MIVEMVVNTNGSGAGTADSLDVEGILQGVEYILTGVHTSTTITLTEADGLHRTIGALTAISASGRYNPVDVSATPANVAYASGTPFMLSHIRLHLVVAGGPNSQAAAVTLRLNILRTDGK